MKSQHHILIIGAGVIGLSLGWKLLQAGRRVTLLEKGETAREASWVGAGMLAPVGEVHFKEEGIMRLGRESLALYPDFVAELRAFTGMEVEYRTEGMLGVSLHADDTAEMRRLFEFQLELGLNVEWLGADRIQRLEPSLTHNAVGGIFAPGDHSIDTRALNAALKAAFLKAGGELLENTPVDEVCLSEQAPHKVIAGGQEYAAETLVLAAGAWSGMIPGLQGALRPLVRPVKGQIITLQAQPGFLTHTLRTVDVYMVPRADGRVVVGATVEEMGFNRDITVGGVFELLRGAWRALPGVYEMPLLETVVGFRPGSRDNAPLLGETDIPGFFLATGHYRNGILNAPATAVYLSRQITGQSVPEFFGEFSPGRFHA